jgi:hypothetical protein
MPIRINLLAEIQAAEEERRKDPVKRTMLAAAFLAGVIVFFAAVQQVKVLSASRSLGKLQSRWASLEKKYEVAVAAQRTSLETDEKLTALVEMSTNRFLWGNALNAFQQTLNNIDGVQVVRFKADQTYVLTEATPTRTNGTTITRGKPGTATEKIKILIEAMDVGNQAGSRVSSFKNGVEQQQYFQQNLSRTNGLRLLNVTAPQITQGAANPFVMFTLECSFPEKTR